MQFREENSVASAIRRAIRGVSMNVPWLEDVNRQTATT